LMGNSLNVIPKESFDKKQLRCAEQDSCE